MPQVILADRSDLFRRSMTSVLQREGYEVLQAETGSRVFELLRQLRPAVLLLDAELEEPSGLDTLQQLKAEARFRRLPVILLSRESSPSVVSNAFRLGAEGFLLKPIDVNGLMRSIRDLLAPVPMLNAPIEIAMGEGKLIGKLRFLDQYGVIYLDKAFNSPKLAPEGSAGLITFVVGRETFRQHVVLLEENAQGLSLLPTGNPSAKSPPEMYRQPCALKARYLLPGQFMRLADVGEVHAQGLRIDGLSEEPRFNLMVQLTLYPKGGGQELAGIPLKGSISAVRHNGCGFEAEISLSEPGGAAYASLLAELMLGRPARASERENAL